MNHGGKTLNGHGREDGFTLVETLVALIILAVSAGLLVQSIMLASAQIKSADLKEAAELLAVSILAGRMAESGNGTAIAGVDPASGLFWRIVQQERSRSASDIKRAGVSIISVEVRTRENAAPLYKLRTLAMKAEPR
jgi:prepilin-type N-terminal cleavage/methylation domain-containing protein